MVRKNIQVERLDQLTPRPYQHTAIQRMRHELRPRVTETVQERDPGSWEMVSVEKVVDPGGSNSVLLADDLGLGKTLMIVEWVRKFGGRILIIAPNVTHLQWKVTFLRQFRTLDPDKVRLVGPHGASGTKYDQETWRRMMKKEGGVFIIGPEHMAGRLGDEITESGAKRKIKPTQVAILAAMRDGRVPPWHKTGVWDAVIFDEVHRARNRKNTLVGKTLRAIKTKRKLGASATPAGNEESDIWYVLNWLWRDLYPSFWDWAKKHFTIEVDEHGWDPVNQCPKTHDEVGAIKDREALWAEIPCVVRRQAKDVLDLPPVIVHEIGVGMTQAQQDMYEDLEYQYFTWMDEVPVGTPLPIVQQSRLRFLALGETYAIEGTEPERVTKLRAAVDTSLAKWVAARVARRDAQKRLEVELDRAGLVQQDVDDAEIDGDLTVLPRAVRQAAVALTNKIRLQGTASSQHTKAEDRLKASEEDESLNIRFKDIVHPKIAALKELLADLPETEPVLVFTHSSKFADQVAKRLGKDAVRWPRADEPQRQESVKKGFGVDYRVLVAVISGIREGVDGLQDRGCVEVWLSQDQDGVNNEQAQGRLNRSGQSRPVQRYYIRTIGTIDEDIYAKQLQRGEKMSVLYGDKAQKS